MALITRTRPRPRRRPERKASKHKVPEQKQHEDDLDLSESGSWTREQTLAYFQDEHDLDLSEDNDKQLAIFIRCEKRGGDVKDLFESTRSLFQAMKEITPEEQALWDMQLRAEGRL